MQAYPRLRGKLTLPPIPIYSESANALA